VTSGRGLLLSSERRTARARLVPASSSLPATANFPTAGTSSWPLESSRDAARPLERSRSHGRRYACLLVSALSSTVAFTKPSNVSIRSDPAMKSSSLLSTPAPDHSR
jgi:hypothetical protein